MNNNSYTRGQLAVVATPIGNLGDMTPRAIEALKSADVIYCEDTRHFSRLAKHFEIKTPMSSYHEHNERARMQSIEEQLLEGKSIALVSDAGTPLVSDPGYHLVNLAHQVGAKIETIPGACAAIAALSVSGFEPHRFIFEGFLPVKKLKRLSALKQAINSGATVIFYESPHRLLSTLEMLGEECPQIEVCVARELTKLHEEVVRGPVMEVHQHFTAKQSIKGEIVLLLRAAAKGFSDTLEAEVSN